MRYSSYSLNDDLQARPVSYKYRYCPRCRREWPEKHQSCPECVHWLGDKPLERTEWQLAPRPRVSSTQPNYELVGASAVVLRIVRDLPPSDGERAAIAKLMDDTLSVANGTACEIAEQGWLVWTQRGLRVAFLIGCEIESRLKALLPRLQRILHHSTGIRWGVWVDQYLISFDGRSNPAINATTAQAIFNFEPDNTLLSSDTIYRENRLWEHFVGAPRRLLGGEETFGHWLSSHKRPSALDHTAAKEPSEFVGRKRQLLAIENAWRGAAGNIRVAICAPAGTGKTRLIKQWLRNHPELRAISANFSLFAGGVEEFASQLADLPSDRLDGGALVHAVLDRIRQDNVKVLILDDLHWADMRSLQFLRDLLAALSPRQTFVILAARPSGREQLKTLQPTVEIRLGPLPLRAIEALARRLTRTEPVAVAAVRRSKGNPLFVEQFVSWAGEAHFRGGESGPRTLHQIVAARIDTLSKTRIADIRQRLRWGGSWQRQTIDHELGQLEAEVGLWLDRLETGDYADRVEAARHLNHLEHLDYEIFLTSLLVGRPRPRSSRLREAIERLLVGSANEVLADLKQRAMKGNDLTKEEISRAAHRAGDVLYAACEWSLAREFYELALSDALWEKDEISRQLVQCRRRSRSAITDDSTANAEPWTQRLEQKPSVSATDLPYVWAELGRRYGSSKYFEQAGEAAAAINDFAFADWAKKKASELDAKR